ncbi:MAG: hypothetical protein JO110_18340, partial [Acetobacteraceae bacterium]|nr:hypothetical protein [Acetobacteraceae bacterium]
ILQHMNAWNTTANVLFVETLGQAQVRIARQDGPNGGFWSFLGTDILSIEADQPTMNLEGFTMDTPESEFHRVVRHETGHTMGFPHEHMRQELVDKIDPEKAITGLSVKKNSADASGGLGNEGGADTVLEFSRGELTRITLNHPASDS